MTAREQAEELRQQAIKTLLEEKKAIDGMLKTLGYGEEESVPRQRGRRPRKEAQELSLPSQARDDQSLPQDEA